ncbi:MAG: hypothetical protein R3229_00085 [Alphaproteobacteria bacterium]|nr:hypothetical protein [Alphaproteobacteria bacterium]
MTILEDWPVFLGLTVCLFGGAAWLMGAAIAATWRTHWQVIGYGLLLALFDRFLHWGLFHGALLSPEGFARDFAVIVAIGLLSWRIGRVSRMVNQYPWLYERAGPLGWRQR